MSSAAVVHLLNCASPTPATDDGRARYPIPHIARSTTGSLGSGGGRRRECSGPPAAYAGLSPKAST